MRGTGWEGDPRALRAADPADARGGPDTERLLERISTDQAVCHGRPCIKGTRVLVSAVLDALAAGLTPAEIVNHHPSLSEEDIQAAATYKTTALRAPP